MPRSETRLDRATVVQTAAILADQLGDVNRLTLAEVAAQLDIKIPSLYNHIDGLAGLRREIALLAVREITAQVQTAAVGRAGEDAIMAIAYAFRAYANAYPGRYMASITAPEPDDEPLIAAAQTLLETLVRALEAYHLSEIDAVHVVRGLRSLMHGFVSLEAADGFKMAVDCDESYERMVRLFLIGLREGL
jgi:AcrR family transcriptional regulator